MIFWQEKKLVSTQPKLNQTKFVSSRSAGILARVSAFYSIRTFYFTHAGRDARTPVSFKSIFVCVLMIVIKQPELNPSTTSQTEFLRSQIIFETAKNKLLPAKM